MLGFPTVASVNFCLQVSFFFTKKKKNEKEVGKPAA